MLRILKPKPKERKLVPVPDELRTSMKEVAELLRDAERDPDVAIDYDDAIQVGRVCGGRIGKGVRPFVLTYYPADDWERGKWFLTLNPTEIEDVADGTLESILMYCCVSSDCRCKFREPVDHCFYCDYDSDPDRGTFPIPEALARLESLGVNGLSESSTLEDVKATVGEPFRTGGGGVVSGLTIHPWAKFRVGEQVVHVEFWTKSGRIKAVTL